MMIDTVDEVEMLDIYGYLVGQPDLYTIQMLIEQLEGHIWQMNGMDETTIHEQKNDICMYLMEIIQSDIDTYVS